MGQTGEQQLTRKHVDKLDWYEETVSIYIQQTFVACDENQVFQINILPV